MSQWILPFQMNQVCWDREAKEMVQISNGTCILKHDSPIAYESDHKGRQCQMVPSEAICYRVVGVVETKRGCDPLMAYTYRKVKPEALGVSRPDEAEAFVEIMRKVRTSRNYGRV